MMGRRPPFLIASLVLVEALLAPGFAAAAGDRVIPQVADGTASDGTRFKTRIDFSNLGPLLVSASRPVTKTQVLFFQQNGLPWSVNTNLGSQSSFTLNLGEYNTMRIETTGTGSLTAGYVIVRSSEPTNDYAEDYELNISAYYEVSKAGSVIDTISVPVGKPTVAWVNPVQTNTAAGLLTGFAVVNLSGKANFVTLRTHRALGTTGSAASETARTSFTLGPSEQKARFLNEADLFPTLTNFYGMIVGTSELPVAVVALLQTPTATGLQYATLEPTYQDSLRRNTYAYLRQGYPLDADLGIVDYFWTSEDAAHWDILFEGTGASRKLSPKSGAEVAVLGIKTSDQFDAEVTIDVLRGLTYTKNPIDMSENSPNLVRQFAFALKTGLGRYAKIRITDTIQRDAERDLALELFTYR